MATNGAASAPLPPGFKQHRCHPRLADVVHTVIHLKPSLFPERFSLMMKCYLSDVGSEPAEPFILDPEEQKIKLRSQRS